MSIQFKPKIKKSPSQYFCPYDNTAVMTINKQKIGYPTFICNKCRKLFYYSTDMDANIIANNKIYYNILRDISIIKLDSIIVKMTYKEMQSIKDDSIEPIDGLITIGNKQRKFRLYYNRNEDIYFGYSRDFELELEDIPYCKILTYKDYVSKSNCDLRPQSLLYCYGYKLTGTTVEYRQKVLRFVIDNKIMTYSQIINHLEFLISMHKGQDCVNIWYKDIDFLRNYNRDLIRKMEVKADI